MDESKRKLIHYFQEQGQNNLKVFTCTKEWTERTESKSQKKSPPRPTTEIWSSEATLQLASDYHSPSTHATSLSGCTAGSAASQRAPTQTTGHIPQTPSPAPCERGRFRA